MRTRTILATTALFAAGALFGWLAASGRLVPNVHAQDKAPAAAGQDPAKPDSPEVAAVRKAADEFTRAFNQGDARAVAAFWTKDGEYVGPDGEALHGREAIEKDYVEFFKDNPKASLEVHIDSVRLLGRHTALEEGSLKLTLPGQAESHSSRYSVLHVREDDGWKMASVREWLPDPSDLGLKDLDWLVGAWLAKTDAVEVRTDYAWDEGKAFLRCRYTLKRGDKAESSGTQLIGKDPAGGLRAWVFDSSGAYGESSWSRDENRWVMEAAGTLPDGSEVTAVNVLIPLGKDAFTWQSTERVVSGSPVPDTPPLRVTRVKAEK
jgi:uncharacterized protein (TIGR02246 family)